MEENLINDTRQAKRRGHLYSYARKKYFSSFGSTLLTSTSLSDGTIRFLWTTAFSIIMVISILGNSSVLWIVIGD